MNNYQLQHKGYLSQLKFPYQLVGSECPFEAPVTLINKDCEGQEYTRSAYWVHCPKLVRDIRDIESGGWISLLQDFIQGPLKKRWFKFINQVPKLLEETLESKYFQKLKREGRANIGGVKDPFHVKCLHAHYGFYLMHGRGFIGEFTHGLLTWKSLRKRSGFSSVYCHPDNVECLRGAPDDQRTLHISNGNADAGSRT